MPGAYKKYDEMSMEKVSQTFFIGSKHLIKKI